MSEESARVSFSKDKIKEFKVGSSGITVTDGTQSDPTGEPILENGSYSSSDILFRNIDKLGEQFKAEEIDLEEDWSNLSEEDAIKDLDKHLEHFIDKPAVNGNPGMKKISIADFPVGKTHKTTAITKCTFNFKDSFCRNCGQKYEDLDNFCADCGNARKTG